MLLDEFHLLVGSIFNNISRSRNVPQCQTFKNYIVYIYISDVNLLQFQYTAGSYEMIDRHSLSLDRSQ